mgnify:CR=1 FL=1
MQQEMEQRTQAPAGRFDGIKRDYTAADVDRLSGSIRIENTLARHGAERLWKLLQEEEPVRALGAVTGNQAMQMVRAGLKSIYLSGWQVAADSNKAGAMYPDQSLYPSDSGPELVRRISNTLRRADQIQRLDGEGDIDWFVPHQANQRILNGVAKRLGLDEEKVISTVAKHGNTSAASIPLALDQAIRDGRIQKGDLVLSEAMGGGFSWGACLFRL